MFFNQHFQDEEPLPASGSRLFFRILGQEAPAVLKLNLLFLLCCLPVVTIPPALLALWQLERRMVEDRVVRSWRHYWDAFRQSWKRSYGAFALTALPMAAGSYGAWFYLRLAEANPLCYAPFMFCAVVLFGTLLSSSYLYGLLAADRPLTKETILLAVKLGLGKPLRAILAALSWYGATAVGILWFPLSGLWLLLAGFSLPCLLSQFLIRDVLKRFGSLES